MEKDRAQKMLMRDGENEEGGREQRASGCHQFQFEVISKRAGAAQPLGLQAVSAHLKPSRPHLSQLWDSKSPVRRF